MRTWSASRGRETVSSAVAEGRIRWTHVLTLYLVVVILASYIGLDFYVHHSGLRLPGCERAGIQTSVEVSSDKLVCNHVDGHFNTELTSWNKSRGDPWRQLKWVGEPAFCRVRGELIEKIDHWNNFRRGWALRFSTGAMADAVEDRTHILPWLYGSRVDLNARARRVYLDLGANTFSSSIQWFTQMYPCDFTEIHAFERNAKLLKVPSVPFDERSNFEAPNTRALRLKKRAQFPQWMLDRVRVYYNFVSDQDDESSAAVNITRFIKEELKLKAEDTVVVKMDIEGAEWAILKRWMNDPEMVAIVDELFVEIHYDDKSMWDFHWRRFTPKTRIDAKKLLAELRWKGIYAHFWP
eukprot:TRINITY_DN2567_c0_g2_i1.p2 TRINITY_DN2567_c0_g2~~TRINITY_DN2567_c0_g2_i1.p2  ORF type:complete len:352 (-),score=51.82 TRINITY_DN2567_c0_g2_i1:346-1401(-)